MVLLDELTKLRDRLQARDITVSEFNEGFKALVNEHKATMSATDKAAVFDKLIDSATDMLTEQEEPYDMSHYGLTQVKLYQDSDNIHYSWEYYMKYVFGNEFFDFYNQLYEGG
jgi:hypothetical protein